MRKWASAIGLHGELGLFLLGCSVPEYRIRVTSVPKDTAQLQVAAYVGGAIAADSPSFAVAGPLDSFTFGLDLSGVPEGQAAISVAARRADGCLLAVGTSTEVPPSSAGTDATLSLVAPEPAVTPAVCQAAPPVTLAVIRSQQGPLQSIHYSLLLQGWGFAPTATVAIRSTASVQCAAGSACNAACSSACTGNGMGMGGPGSGVCLTECAVAADAADIVHSGPALIQVNLEPGKNILQLPPAPGSGGSFVQPIDLLQLLSQPLRLTVTNPDQSQSSFEEAALSGFSP